jgi:hypothetical protein
MTLSLVEEIEQLQNCQTHQECAAWLLTCPYSKLMTYEMAIKARLRTRGFLVGIEHLDSLLASLRSARDEGRPQWSEADQKLGDFIAAIAAGHYREEEQSFPPVGGEGEPI